MGRPVNYVTIGDGYCDVCGVDGDHSIMKVGWSEELTLCKSCYKSVISAMEDIAGGITADGDADGEAEG